MIRDRDNRRKASKAEVLLVGGLGNQLFILAFGVFASLNWRTSVHLIETSNQRGNETHGIKLSATLRLANLPIEIETQTFLAKFRSSLGRFISRCPLIRKKSLFSTTYLCESDLSNGELIPHSYMNSEKVQITGYFQDSRYLSFAQNNGFLNDLMPLAPSPWFEATLGHIVDSHRVGMHVRRGDTVGIPDHGVLSVEYYHSVLASLDKSELNSPILVFSDEPEKLMIEFGELSKLYAFEFVRPPSDSSPIESLVLLSKCETLIISNSTFSWWSANIGNVNRRVIAPSCWSPSGKSAVAPVSGANWHFATPAWRVSIDG